MISGPLTSLPDPSQLFSFTSCLTLFLRSMLKVSFSFFRLSSWIWNVIISRSRESNSSGLLSYARQSAEAVWSTKLMALRAGRKYRVQRRPRLFTVDMKRSVQVQFQQEQGCFWKTVEFHATCLGSRALCWSAITSRVSSDVFNCKQ